MSWCTRARGSRAIVPRARRVRAIVTGAGRLRGRALGPLAVVAALLVALACEGPTGALDDGRLAGVEPLAPDDVHARGELLLARHGCLSCHEAEPAVLARVRPLGAPSLEGIGARVSSSWLAAFIEAPHALRPGTRMPDLLAGLSARERARAVEELVHYLSAQGGPFTPRALPADGWRIDEGARLYAQVGCVACHGVEPDTRSIERKTDAPSLARFLADPLATRPAGDMPDLGLAPDEALAIAAFLLARQHAAAPSGSDLAPGLVRDVFALEGPTETLPDLEALVPASSDTVATVGLEEVPREDEYALRLRGRLRVDEAGPVTLYTASDDGSRLWIDGVLVVDNDGVHSRAEARGTIALAAGWHDLEIAMFEAAGDAVLEAGLVDQDGAPRPFAPDVLAHAAPRFDPIGHAPFTLDAGLARRGARRFASLQCVRCHALPDVAPPARRPPRLDALADLGAGCLAEDARRGVPDHRLEVEDRAALRAVLADAEALRRPLPDDAFVTHAMARLDCFACHERDGRGGPAGERRAAFTGTGDLGDEGRLPPTLDGVGRKLLRPWLGRVLDDGARARPYVHARMPRFGDANVAGLADALERADARGAEPRPPPFDAEHVALGRQLAGRGGFSCIACHETAGHAALGIAATDLAAMHARLRYGWFVDWMREPLALRPGTRMPTYFDEHGRSALTGVLDGDGAAQIDALWTYLSLGDAMPLPDGLVVDRREYAVVPVERPAYVGTFMEGLSARVLAVGFPERVHVAFDQQHVRLAKAWRGAFFDAQGTWRGRAGQLERPAGDDVRDLPPGPAFARLADPRRDPWPLADAWRMRGHVRDTAGYPRFLYATDGIDVEEALGAQLAEGGAALERRFTVRAAAPRGGLVLRAAVAREIRASEGEGGGAFTTSDGLTVRVSGAGAFVCDGEPGQELRVAVPDADEARFGVTLSW